MGNIMALHTYTIYEQLCKGSGQVGQEVNDDQSTGKQYIHDEHVTLEVIAYTGSNNSADEFCSTHYTHGYTCVGLRN